MISFADFEMEPVDSAAPRLSDEAVEQAAPNPAPLSAASHREQKQLGLVRDQPSQSEADNVVAVSRQSQPNARQRKQTAALRGRPRFAEARIEAVLHHGDDGVEIGKAAVAEDNMPGVHVIAFASGARP